MSNQQHHKRIYIAGPMSGLPDCNRPAFHAEANHQRERGHIPLNPAPLPEGGPCSSQGCKEGQALIRGAGRNE